MNQSLVPHVNLWIERDGCVAVSGWRVALLQAIAATGSITEAAQQMDVPYRVAWAKIHEMEQALGMTLVASHVGGADGGGSQLTPAAEDLIRRYQHFSAGMEEIIQQRFAAAFED
ncbi:MAG TPA: LysR family transcriptional regulator [Roseiflexaceae bacterium]|jgi:molybdate transport system regulatory protein|nr:LysR family transcriptional regulator [Roseiflexaceae bacterium]